MKTRDEVLEQVYLNKTDIAILLGITRAKAGKLFDLAKEVEFNQFSPYESKVRMNTVLGVAGITFSQLERQIKRA